MFRRMLASVLFGVLVVGAGVVVYGSIDKGFSATMSSILSGDDDDRDHRREDRRHKEHDDD